MKEILLVGIGGFLGSMSRYGTSLWLASEKSHFPLSTFLVNLAGCLAIGILITLFAKSENTIRLLLITGFCGGFTTFSTFSLELFRLIQNQQIKLALLYLAGSIVLGILMVFLGLYITNKLVN